MTYALRFSEGEESKLLNDAKARRCTHEDGLDSIVARLTNIAIAG